MSIMLINKNPHLIDYHLFIQIYESLTNDSSKLIQMSCNNSYRLPHSGQSENCFNTALSIIYGTCTYVYVHYYTV